LATRFCTAPLNFYIPNFKPLLTLSNPSLPTSNNLHHNSSPVAQCRPPPPCTAFRRPFVQLQIFDHAKHNNAAVHEETLRNFLENAEIFEIMDRLIDRRRTLSPESKLIFIDIIENVWQRVQSGISRGSLSPLLILVVDKYKVILPDSVGHSPERPYFAGFRYFVSFLSERVLSLKCTYLEPIMKHFEALYTKAHDTGKNSVSRNIDIWDTIKDIPECVLVHDYCDQYHEKKDYNKGATSELEYARNYSTHINQLAHPAKEQKQVERFLAEKFPDLLTSLFGYCFENDIKLDFLLQWRDVLWKYGMTCCKIPRKLLFQISSCIKDCLLQFR
ncbi:hypothetical protein Prudu_512S000300, partial [Prunus dulcis]